VSFVLRERGLIRFRDRERIAKKLEIETFFY
jgi:hypothetical protein